MVWDVSGHEPVEVLSQDGDVDDPGFSGDGKTLYTETNAGLVQAWDVAGDRRFLPARPGEHLDWADYWGRFSPDRDEGRVRRERTQVSASGTSPRASSVRRSPPRWNRGAYIDIAWHPDSTTLNITSGDPWVRTWDSTTGRQIARRRLAPPPSTEGAAVAFFSVDGRYLLVGTTEGRLHVLDARTLVPAREPDPGVREGGGERSPKDGRQLRPERRPRTRCTSTTPSSTTSQGPSVRCRTSASPWSACTPHPTGQRLLVGTGPTGIGLLDATTMRWISRPSPAQAGLVGYDTAWSDDGSLVASVNEGRLSHWNGRTGAYLGHRDGDCGRAARPSRRTTNGSSSRATTVPYSPGTSTPAHGRQRRAVWPGGP